jgi:hypothetical protein
LEGGIIKIICYTGGTCGDVITALFDSTDTSYRANTVMIGADRSRFKKPHTFVNDEEKDQCLAEMATKYQSIPSHDLDYHIRRQHEFIGITVQNWDVALWAAQRFKNLHRPHVWAEMTKSCGAKSIEDYAQIMIDFSNLVVQHTDKIVTLESIRAGTALQNLVLQNTDKDFYKIWLDLQT